MNTEFMIQRMAVNAVIIENMVKELPYEQLLWQPAPKKWSIHQVICHLYHEEQNDFKARIDYTLYKPGELWPSFDPEKAVADFDQASVDFSDTLSQFLDERAQSLIWLQKLNNPQWDMAYNHPALGKLSAGDLFVSWLEHDYLHFRQLTNLIIAWQREQAAPYSTKYASP